VTTADVISTFTFNYPIAQTAFTDASFGSVTVRNGADFVSGYIIAGGILDHASGDGTVGVAGFVPPLGGATAKISVSGTYFL
jgi:hypothetical protein